VAFLENESSGVDKRTWLALLAIMAIGAILRFHGRGARSFWIDEGSSYWFAKQTGSNE
jgi:hypothetical protein